MKALWLLILFSPLAFAETYELARGSGTYTVKAFGKTVQGESKELKGKMECGDKECEFLVAAPVKTFASSDSNRDSNMEQTTEASKIPVTTAKGKFPKTDLSQGKWTLPCEVDFHGVKRNYNVTITKKSEEGFSADFILLLEEHKIERPSLFTVKVQNEVPMHFDLQWKKK